MCILFKRQDGTVKQRELFLTILLLVLALMSGSARQVAAHPLGGVVQKTVITDLTNAVLIE